MRRLLLVSGLLGVVISGCSPAPNRPHTTKSEPRPRVTNNLRDETEALLQRLKTGVTDPIADAHAAAKRGEFGLIYIATGRGLTERTPGIKCNTPRVERPGAKAYLSDNSDVVLPGWMEFRRKFETYASRYNQTIIEDPSFPNADLCAPTDSEQPSPAPVGLSEIGPARSLSRSPLSLHEAARRGSLDQVREYLQRTPVDELDDFNMTALTWAVARGREDVSELLLRSGAKSMPTADSRRVITPVLAAISQHRLALLRRLEQPRPFPLDYVEAAIESDHAGIVREVLDAPHDTPDLSSVLRFTTPSREVAALLIRQHGDPAADAVLLAGARSGRLDLVRLAVQVNADVDVANRDGETPLNAALERRPNDPDPMPVVQALVAAGADVNAPPPSGGGWGTPFWRAYERAASPYSPRIDLLRLLARAGGDARIPLYPGEAPVWTVVFPVRGDQSQVRLPSAEVLEIMVRAGMDLNAIYMDRCVLDAVEQIAGAHSSEARTLRRLGAKRRTELAGR